MFLVNEEGYEFMVIGANEDFMRRFDTFLLVEDLENQVSVSVFNVPKNGKVTPVAIINCDNLKRGSYAIRDYLLNSGLRYDKDNVDKLFNV